MTLAVVAAPILVGPCAAGGDKEDASSAPPADSVMRLRDALRPLLTLSRLVGLAPFNLDASAQLRLRRSQPATAYSMLLLAAHAVLVYFYVTFVCSVRYSNYDSSLKTMFFLRMALEVGVALLALVSALTSSGRNAMQALLESAEHAATLLPYEPQRSHRLLLAQACLVIALLPLYLYFAEEEFMGAMYGVSSPLQLLTTLQLVLVHTCRACAFVLNAVTAMQFYACVQLTAQLWRRLVEQLREACDGAPWKSCDVRKFQRNHVALVALTKQVSAAFGRQAALQVYHVKAVLVTTSFVIVFIVLTYGAPLEDGQTSSGSIFLWQLVPKLVLGALCFAQLLAMYVPCAAIENSAAQCVDLTHRLIGCARFGAAAHAKSSLLAMLAAQQVRLETATGAALGASLWADTVTHVLAYVLLLAQMNCILIEC